MKHLSIDRSTTRHLSDRAAGSRPSARGLIVTVALVLATAGCAGGTAPVTSTGSSRKPATSAPPELDPVVARVSPARWSAMVQAGMVRPECPVKTRAALRVVTLNNYDFEGRIQRGTLVVNRDVTRSVVRIFDHLFREKFPIRRMEPVEAFDGDTKLSLRADNTSAFNCRRPDQINAPFTESPHANGRAIDINPRENPWKDLRCTCWVPSGRQRERTPGPGKILKGGHVWRAFIKEGWVWQDIKVPDYMHFDTGYPSQPFRRPRP